MNIEWEALAKIAIAYALALPVGWERERNAKGAGLRTFPLVAMASCAFLLAGSPSGVSTDTMGRVLVGIMTGIGFIGGGVIMREGTSIHGTATAASIWNMGATGACVAFDRYDLAVALTALNYVSLLLVRPPRRDPDV